MAKLSEFIQMIKLLKCLYCSYSTSSQHVWSGPNELVEERFLVTCFPASQSSVKSIKKCLLLKRGNVISSIPGLLNECVFILTCISCCHFLLLFMDFELLINVIVYLSVRVFV